MFLLGWFRARLLIFSALTLKTLIVQISQRAYERFLCLFLLPVFVKKMFQRQWPVWNSAVRKVGDKKHDDIQNSCRYELIIDRPNKTLSQLLFFFFKVLQQSMILYFLRKHQDFFSSVYLDTNDVGGRNKVQGNIWPGDCCPATEVLEALQGSWYQLEKCRQVQWEPQNLSTVNLPVLWMCSYHM